MNFKLGDKIISANGDKIYIVVDFITEENNDQYLTIKDNDIIWYNVFYGAFKLYKQRKFHK